MGDGESPQDKPAAPALADTMATLPPAAGAATSGHDPTVEAQPAQIRKDPMIGVEILGQYRVLDRLGAGGFGVVYTAEQVGTGRRAAVKVLRPDAVDERMRERFLREGRFMSRFQHPNIVTVYNVGALEAGTLFIAMEYVEGESLQQVLRAGAMPTDRVLRITEQVAKALEAAHHHGIVHRDLKPENIMLMSQPGEEPDLVKVLDFGIARTLDEPEQAQLTATGMVIGTPQFMSPEQAQGQAVTEKSDIYNAGLILYLALTGRHAVAGKTPVEILVAHATAVPKPLGELTSPEAVPPSLSRLVMRCLDKDPAERPSAEELRRTLADLRVARAASRLTEAHGAAQGDEVAAPVDVAQTVEAVEPAARSRPVRRKSRAPLLLAALVLLVLAVIGGTLAVFGGDGAAPDKASAPHAAAEQVEPATPPPEASEPPGAERPEAKPAAEKVPMPAAPEGMLLVGFGDVEWAPDGPESSRKHRVEAFFIDTVEVTVESFARCVEARACAKARTKAGTGAVTMLSAGDAAAYCAWREARLPTVLEWLHAATSGTQAEEIATGKVAEWVSAGEAWRPKEEGQVPAMGVGRAMDPSEPLDPVASFAADAWFDFVGFRCAADVP